MHLRVAIVGAVVVAIVAAGVTVAVVRPEGHSQRLQAAVDGRHGGSIQMGDARLSVPPGSVSGSGHLLASSVGAPTAASGLASGLALANSGAPVHFEVAGARITGPVQVTFRVGKARLPQGLPAADSASAIWLACYDSAAGQWQPVASRHDPAAGTVTATVRNLSWWAPWTWDWQGFALRLRQLLSALGAGRAPAASCPGVRTVTATSVGGQDPPLVGCATERGTDSLTVSITNNRGVSVVMSSVPSDAAQDPPAYHGFDEYIATRDAVRNALGGADLAPSQTLTYSLPLHGPAVEFMAAPTLKSYALDLAQIVGEALVGAAQFAKLSGEYATCILNAVASSEPASFADTPRVAVKCLPALGEAVPALKGLASLTWKLVQIDAIAILQDYDLIHDAIRGVTGAVNIACPASVSPSPPAICPNSAQLLSAWNAAPVAVRQSWVGVTVTGFSGISCWKSWVVTMPVSPSPGNGLVVFSQSGGLHLITTAELQQGFRNAVCPAADAPPGWKNPPLISCQATPASGVSPTSPSQPTYIGGSSQPSPSPTGNGGQPTAMIAITSVFAADSSGNKQVNFNGGDSGQLSAQLTNPSSAQMQATANLRIWNPNSTVDGYDASENMAVPAGTSTFSHPLTFASWLKGPWFYTLTIASAAGTTNAQTQLNFSCAAYG